jgi:hypothetical protein
MQTEGIGRFSFSSERRSRARSRTKCFEKTGNVVTGDTGKIAARDFVAVEGCEAAPRRRRRRRPAGLARTPACLPAPGRPGLGFGDLPLHCHWQQGKPPSALQSV